MLPSPTFMKLDSSGVTKRKKSKLSTEKKSVRRNSYDDEEYNDIEEEVVPNVS